MYNGARDKTGAIITQVVPPNLLARKGPSNTVFTIHRLKWLGFILPIPLWIGAVLVRIYWLPADLTVEYDLLALTALVVVALIFWLLVFTLVESREEEIRQRTQQLEALHSAALALTTELDLSTVLQKVVDLSRGLVNARYGAVGVLAPDGKQIAQFITSGITEMERAHMGQPPQGFGLLGMLIREAKPVRVRNIGEHPRSYGFPPNHPPMTTLMGVPIISKGKVIGDIYLTDKQPDSGKAHKPIPFTQMDQEILQMFATQAAIAIENAQLYRQIQQLAILQERERFSMDLHDGIIQSIYAIGLMLDDSQFYMDTKPELTRSRILKAIGDLNEVIRDIRNYILELRPQRFQGRDLARGIEELAREIRANTFLTVHLETETIPIDLLTPEQTVEILHIAQETLTNVRKHARATDLTIRTWVDEEMLHMDIADNGVGFEMNGHARNKGNGLHNMNERAASLRGRVEIGPRATSGTCVSLRIPLK